MILHVCACILWPSRLYQRAAGSYVWNLSLCSLLSWGTVNNRDSLMKVTVWALSLLYLVQNKIFCVNIAVHHLESPAFYYYYLRTPIISLSIVKFEYDQMMTITCILRNWGLNLHLPSPRLAWEGEMESGKRQFLGFLPHCISAVGESKCVWDIQGSGLTSKLGLSSE